MSPFRGLLPTFERPLAPPTFINIRPEGSRLGRKIGILVAGAFMLGIALAQFDNSPTLEATAMTASPAPPAMALAEAAAPVQSLPVAKPAVEKPRKAAQVVCEQKASVRRECADMRAAKEAKLLPLPVQTAVAAPARPGAEAVAQPKPETVPSIAAQAMAAVTPTPAEAAPATPARAAARQKPKKPRVPADDPVVERLVHVYDQIGADGRRVPVYRRASGGYETGTIVDDEYRPSRRVNLEPQRGARYFGLQ